MRGKSTKTEDSEAPTREAIAAHEAGHAVAAWALGRPVGRMWIDTGGGTEIGNWTELSLTDQVALHRAGACGTQILKVLAPSWMAHKDVEKVVSEVLAGLPYSVAEEHIRRGGVRAYQFLEANQALLKVVANTLEQAGTLDGAEFSALAAEYGAKPFAALSQSDSAHSHR